MANFLFMGILLAGIFGPHAPGRACELALVLAVDVSASISSGEYDFQMQGLADALEDPVIAGALIKGQSALVVVQWSGVRDREISISWQRMKSQTDVDEFSRRVLGVRRKWSDGLTAIGSMMKFVKPLFSTVSDCRRMVLDISGDGRRNAGVTPNAARDELLAQGVTINGIAIDRAGDDIAEYFRSDIIGGAGSFVLAARGYRDYPAAIRKKLFREIVQPSS